MLKIDIHTHILPEHIPNWKEEFGYGGFIKLEHHSQGCAKMTRDDGHFFREINANCWSPETRISEADSFDIDVQVLSTVPVMFAYWAKAEDCAQVSRVLNDGIAAICDAFPKRFIGLATVPMQSPKYAVAELLRAKELGHAGVEIGSNVNQKNLGDAEFQEFFAACEELEMAVFVHPWEMIGTEVMPEYWLPWLVGMPAETSRAICSLIFSGTLEKFSKLRIAFAHGGGAFPATIGRIEHGFNVRPDLCAIDNQINPREYASKIYFDSLVHDAEMLKYLVDLAGVSQVALGTDYPFPLGELEPGSLIESMNFTDQEKATLFHGAALAWLNRDRESFE
ncbi:MAG: amidohydrolase family protein [Pyrinomonadaceae bacterium]